MSRLNDEEFHAAALQGGASRNANTGNVPDRGFMVGGASTLKGEKFPEQQFPVDKFHVDHVRHHARAIRDAFGGRSNVYQGAWVQNNNVVLDASEQFNDQDSAMSTAKDRGEDAIYDVSSGTESYTN